MANKPMGPDYAAAAPAVNQHQHKCKVVGSLTVPEKIFVVIDIYRTCARKVCSSHEAHAGC